VWVQVTVELQFTPTRTATSVHRSTVETAFLEAGIPVARWTVPAGEDEFASLHPQVPFADPTLGVHLVVADAGAASYATGMATFTVLPALGRACSVIRAAIPDLPMGIDERVGNERRHLAFRPADDSAAIVRSFEGFPRKGLGPASIWFWSSDEDRWAELVITRQRDATPGSPWHVTASERSP
jgi:hypothetical protein